MKKGIYIQLFSLHGLFRGDNLELGRDADTGGQILYVLELAKQLSKCREIRKVDIFTRLLDDKTVSSDYSEPIETVNEKLRIVRIRCGGKKYIRKELLWPFLEEYIDRTTSFIKKEDDLPDFIHGHYADAGYIAMRLSEYFGTPFIFTGHSLGRSKLQRLLEDGMKKEDIIKKYKIDHRIDTEETILNHADLIVASTNHEVLRQYGSYESGSLPEFSVITPGFDLNKFYPFYHEKKGNGPESEKARFAYMNAREEMNRFFINTDKPLILTICRPEKRKNIKGLIEAFGMDKELQAMANLAIFAGIRKDISTMEDNEKDVLTEMLLLMDKYDLYGKMAIPKKNDFEYEVPALYRFAAEKNGVFTNIALIEPFGLTLIEASASGVPIVATSNGGPSDIIRNLKNGEIVDPLSPAEISHSIKKIITDKELWNQYSRNGVLNVKKYYTWEAHCRKYLEDLNAISSKKRSKTGRGPAEKHIGKRMAELDLLIITDIDHTLIGGENPGLSELMAFLKENRSGIGFGVATGRTMESASEYLKTHGVITPDIFVTSVGTEIYYKNKNIIERGWQSHIRKKWDRRIIRDMLTALDFLTYQEEHTQREFKVSFLMEPDDNNLAKIHNLLGKKGLSYKLIYSHDRYLDIIPFRASKGKAIKYLGFKWDIPFENILVCGDSGNDESMLRGGVKAVVVSNYSHELEKLRGHKDIYFSDKEYAEGILDGIGYFDFAGKIKRRGKK